MKKSFKSPGGLLEAKEQTWKESFKSAVKASMERLILTRLSSLDSEEKAQASKKDQIKKRVKIHWTFASVANIRTNMTMHAVKWNGYYLKSTMSFTTSMKTNRGNQITGAMILRFQKKRPWLSQRSTSKKSKQFRANNSTRYQVTASCQAQWSQ